MIPTVAVGPSIHDGVNQAGGAFWLAATVDFHVRQIERIEAYFDALASQMRRCFKEAPAQQERRIAAHQTIRAMKEQAARVGGRRQLTDPVDVTLPTQKRRDMAPRGLYSFLSTTSGFHSVQRGCFRVCCPSRLSVG